MLHPQHPFDRCLGTGTKAVPSTEAGKPLKLYFDNQWHTKLYTDRDSSEGYADGFQLKRFSTGRVVLLDGGEAAVAVCIRAETFGLNGARQKIYGLKPRYEGQKPSKDHNHDGLALSTAGHKSKENLGTTSASS